MILLLLSSLLLLLLLSLVYNGFHFQGLKKIYSKYGGWRQALVPKLPGHTNTGNSHAALSKHTVVALSCHSMFAGGGKVNGFKAA